ncbi:MAG: DUF2934 domain-containing protein [Gammaproteobacteria bacterium]
MAEKHTESSVAQAANAAARTKKRAKKTSKPASSGMKQAVNSEKADSPPFISSSLRHQMIAETAYYLAERRGFISGYELEDWFAAELAIDAERDI